MLFGYTIIYVPDVEAAVSFYEKAFQLKRRFVHESGTYAEMETGSTLLAFAADELGEMNLPEGYRKNVLSDKPAGIEIVFVSDDVAGAFTWAISAGATAVSQPETKPWGQTVAYVRDLNGVVIELASPM
ncbi:MAG: VOC family protein [Anaerolineae bacterium]